MSIKRTEHPEWTDRFSAYLDGELTEDERGAVEDHLAECGACRRVLEEMRVVIAQADELDGIEPPRDLWAGIAATIQAPVATAGRGEAKVIELPTSAERVHHRAEEVGETRYAFSRPQLAAAAIVLVAASSMVTWLAGPGVGVPGEAGVVDAPAGAVTMAATSVTPPAGLAEELANLEGALSSARDRLDPNTVRVLERNLSVIEQAILDSHHALAQDPENEFLADHLQRVYERKMTYLRDATRLIEWTG